MYLLQRPEDIPPRLSSRLSLRIAILTAVVIAALATVLLRLWSLQVLDGQHYRALAQDHGVLNVRVHPPRGEILDRNGKVLVDNRTVMSLEMRPSDLPADPVDRRRELDKLGDVLGLPQGEIRRRVRATAQYAGYPVVLKQGLDRRLLFYLLENKESFPGVSVERTYVRKYPDGTLAAHVLGLVGQISPRQLKQAKYRAPPARRHHRPGRRRVQLRQVPARHRRQSAGSGRRPWSSARDARQSPRPCRRQPAPVSGFRATGGWRIGASGQGPARRLRGDGRPLRGGPRDGLLPDL